MWGARQPEPDSAFASRRWPARLLLLLLLPLAACRPASAPAPPDTAATYVDPSACQPCHAEIYRTYQSTGMARSFYRPAAANRIEDYTAPANVLRHAPSGQYFRMTERDGRFYQRRWLTDAAGAEMSVYELEAHYVIGSGNHARTYLHQSGSELIQLPVSWYPRERRWAMSPGYDRPDHPGFRRRLDYGCFFCHNAYPAVPAGADRFGVTPRFPAQLPQGIDCQRCHGPGSLHVASPRQAGVIVNPAKLDSPQRKLDVCLQCHLETTSAPLPGSTRRAGRGVFSFRPGELLSAYAIFFDHADGAPAHESKFEIAGGGYRFLKSACFTRSAGRLTCTTCHNPHDIPRGEPARRHYNAQCRQCHPSVPGAPHLTAAAAAAPPDCIACHMPKRRTDDAVHVVMTDHWIQRRPPPGDLLAPRAEQHEVYRGPVKLYAPDTVAPAERDLYLGIAHAAEGASPATGIALLEQQANGRAPSAKALAILADALAAQGNTAAAISRYRQALALDPALERVQANLVALSPPPAGAPVPDMPEAHYARGNALAGAGRREAAADAFRRAIALRPDYAEAIANLAGLTSDEALTRQALAIDPRLASANNNLARILAAQGSYSPAIALLRRALESEPAHREARLNLGRLLYQTNRQPEALAEFRRLVKEAPDFAEAHLSLGLALGERGDLAAAIAAFQETLRLAPGHPEASRNLQVALELQRSGSRR